MSYDLSNDAQPPQPIPLPGISEGGLRRLRRLILAFGILLLAFLVLWWARGAYTDLLWFDHLGYRSVFLKVFTLKLWLFCAGTLVSATALSSTLYLAWRRSRGESTLGQSEGTIRLLYAVTGVSAALVVVIGAPLFGESASDRWETLLLLFNRVPFGIPDPQFSRDPTFYMTTLPVMQLAQEWLMGLAITMILATASLYGAVHAIRGLGLPITQAMLKHLAVLGAFLMLTIAASHGLDVYKLVLSQGGLVAGATYTDVHARIPALLFMASIAMVAMLGFAVSSRNGSLRLVIGSFILWVLVALLAGLLYPALFQRFQVTPNEFAKEAPYIQRNIEATRRAYQLDQVRQESFPASGRLDSQAIRDNRASIENIRLWDVQPLEDAYNQLQFMELYYQFLNMDSDRYEVDGRLRQVLVAARELHSGNLPPDAQNWVNLTLQYTHGYGISMSPANSFSPGEGRPNFFIQDIPIKGRFAVNRPEMYYGESAVDFVIVGHDLPEVNPGPASERQAPYRYQGAGGIPLDSTLRRLSYAWQMGDVNILLSDQITRDSRIQYRRQIDQRVKAIAPFLKLDRDPYPVLDENGRLWWIQDAYTTTARYPYSTRLEDPSRSIEGLNYIRNSVKVVVDAYNGGVVFYALDPQDTLLQMYRRAFPSLFVDLDRMPKDLRSHLRYPMGLFSSQARMYLRYHVTDPQTFFNQAEQWAIPLETRFGKQGVQMTPSYLVLKNPDEEREEFVLMLPFSPAGDKKNLVGWLLARNDDPNYGELVAYNVPGDVQVDGPSQVEARIQNDQNISQQFSLWQGAGSQVIRGQLLVIPIADTIVYVESLYLQSESLAFPELKKVILADGSDVVMADSVDLGLAMLAGELPPSVGPSFTDTTLPDPGPALEEQQIEEAFAGIGETLGELEDALENLKEALGGRQQ